jgi:hypothetical protein
MTALIPPEHCFFVEHCSRLSLLYSFYGFVLPLFGEQWPYFALLLGVLAAVSYVFEVGLALLPGLFHLLLGTALGFYTYVILKRPILLPSKVAKHRHAILWFMGELLLLVLAFVTVDLYIPETGFNYGLWLSAVLFAIWWGILFFVNLLQNVPSPAAVATSAELSPETRDFMQTYILLLIYGLTFYLVAAVPVLSQYWLSVAATLLTLVEGIAFSYAVDRG